MKMLNVKIPPQKSYSYPIYIGSGIIKDAYSLIKECCRSNKFLIVTNETVYKLHSDKLDIPNSKYLVLPDGEEYKNSDFFNLILDKAVENSLERIDAIVAFGGGVIGDMAGFAASTYQRGINFIQIPTTLLAQVDSSVGGKVAINHKFGKNLIGSFYQPGLVIIDIELLKTLPEKQFKTGMAEVVKYAFIEKACRANENFDVLNFLADNANSIKFLDNDLMSKLIFMCCSLKSSVVSQDEKEQGLRRILNFGHTFAHSIETLTNYKKYTHGEAVAIGMRMAFKLAKEMNLIDDSYFNLAIKLLSEFDLDYKLEIDANVEEFIDSMQHDKKVENSKIRFVLPISFQNVNIFENVDKNILKKLVDKEL